MTHYACIVAEWRKCTILCEKFTLDQRNLYNLLCIHTHRECFSIYFRKQCTMLDNFIDIQFVLFGRFILFNTTLLPTHPLIMHKPMRSFSITVQFGSSEHARENNRAKERYQGGRNWEYIDAKCQFNLNDVKSASLIAKRKESILNLFNVTWYNSKMIG